MSPKMNILRIFTKNLHFDVVINYLQIQEEKGKIDSLESDNKSSKIKKKNLNLYFPTLMDNQFDPLTKKLSELEVV